jgi:twitching motility protein PilT
MDIKELFKIAVKEKASDLHLLVDIPPTFRIDGFLKFLTGYAGLKQEEIEEMIFSLLTPSQKELLIANRELDFSFDVEGDGPHGRIGRFRTNLYYQRRSLSGAFRLLPPSIISLEELHLPQILHNFSDLTQGLVLITGPTGHGKSTTLASIINEVNLKRAAHIITIEDPIEYVYPDGKSIISQREMGIDTHSWDFALRSALREDPDVVLVGEMRDPETISAAITIAETGHLVFSTLHTNSAAQSIDRIIDSFQATQQAQIKIQLAATLKGVVSQRLLPMINGGRVPAVEVLLGTSAVASIIREGKTHLIDSVIQTSKDKGMIGIDSSLAALVLSGTISMETGKSYSLHQEDFLKMIG